MQTITQPIQAAPRLQEETVRPVRALWAVYLPLSFLLFVALFLPVPETLKEVVVYLLLGASMAISLIQLIETMAQRFFELQA